MSESDSDFMSNILSGNDKDEVTLSLTASLLDTETSKKQTGGAPSMSEINRNLKKMRYRLVSDTEYSAISQMSNNSQRGGSTVNTLSETSEFENDEPSVSLSKTITSRASSVSDASATQVTDSEKLSESSILKELGLTESDADVDYASDDDDKSYKSKSISVFLSETSDFIDE